MAENTIVIGQGPESQPEVDVSKIVAINRQSFGEKLRAYSKKPVSMIGMLLVMLAALITAAVVLWILIYTLVQGLPSLKAGMFSWTWTDENFSFIPALINTLIIAGLSLLIAVPIGVFAAIFMSEYAKSTNIFVKIVRMAAETLSGIPSIVYGIFGNIFFVTVLGWGYSMIAGILTMSIMILSLIMRTTEEALLAVPDSFREGSYALGAGKLRTIFVIILPSAMSGIISGIILGLGRVVGETAALIYSAGSPINAAHASGLMTSGCTLSVFLYSLMSEGEHVHEAWATAVVLIVLVVIINGAAEFVGNKLKKEY
mgnify:FL=1